MILTAKAGGNARPAAVEEGGERLEVAMGPTFFLPSHYRALMAVFTELGVQTERRASSLTVYGLDGEPRFVSPTLRPLRLRPLVDLKSAGDLAVWLKILAATVDLRRRGDVPTTWGEFIESRRFPVRFVREIAEPVASAFLGVSFEELRGISASCALLYPALALPTLSRGVQAPIGVRGGTHRWIERILADMARVRFRLGDPVRRVTRQAEGVLVESDGEAERYVVVVVAVPVWSAGKMLGGVVAEAAAMVPFVDVELVVHRQGGHFRKGSASDSDVSVRAFPHAAQLTTTAGWLSGREVFRSWATQRPSATGGDPRPGALPSSGPRTRGVARPGLGPPNRRARRCPSSRFVDPRCRLP